MDSARAMGLKSGESVTALVKASELSILEVKE
jgi:molybdopterin-binding protein